jgi:hypothetical protein
LKIKLRDRHFETVEVIEAESLALLNILIQHDFQNAFENGRITGKGAYVRKGTTSRAMVASRPKVRFCPDASSNPGNYEYQYKHVPPSSTNYTNLRLIICRKYILFWN